MTISRKACGLHAARLLEMDFQCGRMMQATTPSSMINKQVATCLTAFSDADIYAQKNALARLGEQGRVVVRKTLVSFGIHWLTVNRFPNPHEEASSLAFAEFRMLQMKAQITSRLATLIAALQIEAKATPSPSIQALDETQDMAHRLKAA